MPDKRSVSILDDRLTELSVANKAFAQNRPGSRPERQPVHTVYGGAQLFRSDTAPKMGALARSHLLYYAPNPESFMRAFDFEDDETQLADAVYRRLLEKLETEPVEDFRIDFEDGFGVRTGDVEDEEARRAGRETARGLAEGTLPPFIGIRIKPLNEEYRDRALRTLELFLSALTDNADGRIPDNFVVTLPKITIPEQVTALAAVLDVIEARLGIPAGTVGIEFMIETPSSIFDPRGGIAIPALVAAAAGRCTGAHFGVYDYTALLEITAAYQTMAHDACDFARHAMQVALAGTGIWISDGATNVMPVGPHRASKSETLSPEQELENREAVYAAWKLAYRDILHSLGNGFYQGWDLHPAQLTARYAAVYSYFLQGFEAAAERLGSFVDKAAQATLVGNIFDDAATGQGLLNYFLRAVNSGAISMEEAGRTGLTMEEFRSRSFSHIVKERTRRMS